MDNLDALSNEELHVRLLEMGFANMPVTTTTRKVLIKKLRKQIDSELSKTRRETINAIKHSSDEESESDSRKIKTNDRRATVGAPTIPKVMRPPSQPRRSGRITPVGKSEQTATVILPSVPDIIEDTDDDDVIIIEDRRSKSKTPTGYGRRELSSVSIKPIIFNESDEKMEKKSELIQPKIKNNTEYESTFMRNSPSKQQPPEILTSTKQYTVGSTSTSTGPKRNYGLTMGRSSYTSGIDATTGIGASSGIRSASSSSTSYGLPLATSTFSRPSVTTSYNTYDTRKSYNYIRNDEKTSEEECDEGDDDYDYNNKFKSSETPYLSDFTRRLSCLKPEPLFQQQQQTQSPYRNIVNQRTGINTERKQTETNVDEFKLFYKSLNDKYSINRKIFYLSFILFVILIIVFLFM